MQRTICKAAKATQQIPHVIQAIGLVSTMNKALRSSRIAAALPCPAPQREIISLNQSFWPLGCFETCKLFWILLGMEGAQKHHD